MEGRPPRGQGRGVGEEEERARQGPPQRLSKHRASALCPGAPQVAFNREIPCMKSTEKAKKSSLCIVYLGLYPGGEDIDPPSSIQRSPASGMC